MTKYICKCGRVVAKNTTADNTGNRDTAGCEGCPYLLPWGPYQWDDTRHAMVTEVRGYECRMSQTLDYTTYYQGNGSDKCVLHIYSLDYDFLDRVAAWAAELFPGKEIGCSFDRTRIRAAEFIGGLYGMSVYPMQNKKGIAAKAALLAEFFGPDKHRLDMPPEEEKAHILAAIEAGKTRAQKGENKKVEYIISRNTENGLTYAYYRGAFWFWDERAGRWFLSPHAKELYAGFSAGQPGSKPEDMLYSGSFEPLDDWDIPAKVIDDLLSRNPKKEKRENPTPAAEDVQPCAPSASDAPLFPSPSANADVQQGGKDAAANPTDAAPASPAGAGAATQSLSAAAPASLEAESAPAAFDYSGLDASTAERLRNLARRAMEAKQRYVLDLMEIVVEAHRELCDTVVARCDNGTFGKKDDPCRAWCASIGVGRSTAYNLLQVQALMDGSTPEEQEVLAEAPAKLLYAAAKPSAPAELVQAVKDGDITTHKQYQELLAEVRERDAKIQELLEMSEAADRRADEAQAWAKKTEQEAALDRKEREDANAAAMRYKAECDRQAAEQQRVEGLLTTREDQLRASQAEVARQKRIGMEMQEEVKSRDERIRELEQSQTVVASTADPEEIERRAHEIAQSQIAENDAKWTEITENQGRQLRELRAAAGAAQAVRIAIRSVQSILESLFQTMLPEKDDIAGQAALEELDDLLSEYSNYIHDMFRTEENREEAEV